MLRWLVCTATAGVMALALPAASQPRAAQAEQPTAKSISSSGQQIFTSACAGCHGLDGRGGGRAPNLTAGRVQQLADRDLRRIVKNGIAGTAMPAFRSLPDADIQSIVAYVRTLQGAGGTVPFPGDPRAGKALFFGKAKCSTCHMVKGQGGFIASDLSEYGRSRSPREIRQAIESPPAGEPGGGRMATVLARDGREYSGVVRNEDNFSLQLQSLDGAFHLFTKLEVKKVEYGSKPLMPANYGSVLSRKELDDIVSYMMELAGSASAGKIAGDATHP